MKPFDKHSPWYPLNEFVEAGKVTDQTAMRFRDRCDNIRRKHGSTRPNFLRALIRVLKTATDIESTQEIADRFMLERDTLPADPVDDAPAIGREIEEAARELSEASAKLEAARAREQEAEARLARIDELIGQLPRLKESLDYLETMPETWEKDIATAEANIFQYVYSAPKYASVGDPAEFVAGWEKVIAAAKAAIAAHPARIEKTRALVDGIKVEIAELKKARRKTKSQ